MASPISPLGWAAIGGLALLLWRGSRSARTSSRPVALGPVAVIGDSLAVGLAGPLKLTLGRLGEITGWGVGGSIAAMWTMQVDAVLATDPRTVIVSLGTNDALSADARAKFPARIRLIADKVRAAGALPVLLESPARLSRIGEMNSALGATGSTVVAPPVGIMMQADNVHPTPAGYQQWANHIARQIS